MSVLHLDNDVLFQIAQKNRQIGEYLLTCDFDYTDNIGIMDGLAGLGMTLSLFYRNTGDERYFDKMNQIIDLLHEKIYSGKVNNVSYCSGLAGFAWMIVYLKETELIEVDADEYLSEIDSLLLHNLMLMIETKEFDPLHSAVGIGFYFLKRDNFKAIENIIDGLYNDRKSIDGYMTWSRIDRNTNTEIVDFGFAHGIFGTLFFLYKCYLKNISSSKCSEMIRDNISFLLNYMNPSGTPSYFPSSVELDKITQYNSKQNFSRLAWCYGDLTAFSTLLKMSSIFPAQIDVINALEHVAQRRKYSETLVKDAGLCHGTSCIAHIFNRLYQETGKLSFAEAANCWVKQTLLFGNEADGITGYVFNENPNTLPLDLLVGISGVGAALTSFQNPELINWDESIFLS